ncbi:MAG: MetQ/NlpA family ABC transporter substrate-binding protein [Coriobacteriia bacterium]|nr:MetQ/NlpA family ABC transporter substrate-binding protein [Coriobacteriia bacterium]
MKYRKWLLVALALVLAFALVGCGGDDTTTDDTTTDDSSEVTTLRVGATASPHAEILEQVKEDLKAQGIDLEIIEFSDYVTPNTALDSGELDANFFQHVPYLDDFNSENGTDLVSVLPIHFEPLTIYAGQSDDLKSIADGATIAIPNDTTNEARALLLLEAEGLISLKEGVGIAATPADIVDNAHNIKFVEAEAAALPRLLDDADFAVINGNFALSAGIDSALALASESADSEAADMYANVLVVKAGNENDAGIQKLISALKSDSVRTFINESYDGVVVPVF